jgi:hypothetical protein
MKIGIILCLILALISTVYTKKKRHLFQGRIPMGPRPVMGGFAHAPVFGGVVRPVPLVRRVFPRPILSSLAYFSYDSSCPLTHNGHTLITKYYGSCHSPCTTLTCIQLTVSNKCCNYHTAIATIFRRRHH